METPTWLNLCFVEKILRKSEDDNSIQVIDIFSKPATNKGDNYTSDMIRISAEFSRDQGDRKITEKKSMIVKIAPTVEGVRQDLVSWFNLFNVFNIEGRKEKIVADFEVNLLLNYKKIRALIFGVINN